MASQAGSTWSNAARSVWAKTDRATGTSLSLVQHLTDTAAVAGELWDHWLAPNVRRVISTNLPDGEADGRRLVTFMAGIHDIGKAAPGFAIKARRAPSDTGAGFSHLAEAMERQGLVFPPGAIPPHLPAHSLIGHVIVADWLEQQQVPRAQAHTLAGAVGAHHGNPPTAQEVRHYRLNDPLWTGRRKATWRDVQNEFLDTMAQRTGAAERLPGWAASRVSKPAQVLVSAVVIVADWLASDPGRFPYHVDAAELAERLARADVGGDLVGPWRPAPPEPTDQLFERRFPGLSPSPTQRAFIDAAARATEPSLLVLEAPMGSGKTEAALAAAEVLAHRCGAGGVFVALPTMATSDAMFGRVLAWTEHLDNDVAATITLAHGRARLNERYHGLRSHARFVPVNEHEGDGDHLGRGATEKASQPSAGVVVSSWLQGRRKGVLANLVVGTIDQVLVSALKTRYLALRHLALAGKVVIVDEVHAADAYMREYLVRALHWCGAYGVPVILLSATLPPEQRDQLTHAYASGRAGASSPGQPEAATHNDDIPGYPCITVQANDTQTIAVDWTGRSVEVSLRPLDDSPDSLVRVVRAAVDSGACVVVMRNTVQRAQEAYEVLAEAVGTERIMLTHSRFPAAQRAARDARVLDLLGPPSSAHRPTGGFVVVGTQVLEQSLDIDADLLVTDLAPVDLMLQRIGRLHRHERGPGESARPAAYRTPVAYITGVTDWLAGPPTFVRGSERVYGPAALLRSVLVLEPLLNAAPATRDERPGQRKLAVPGDVPALVRRGYARDLQAPADWAEALRAADERAERENKLACASAQPYRLDPVDDPESLLGWLEGRASDSVGDGDDLGRAQVRDSEDSLEVVLVWRDEHGQVRLLPDDPVAPQGNLGIESLAPPEPRLALAAANSTVRLPSYLTRGAALGAVTAELEEQGRGFTGWRESPWLAGQLVLCLGPDLQAVVGGWRIRYCTERGLRVEQQGKELA